MEASDQVDGVWVTSHRCAMPVAVALRQSLIELAATHKAGEERCWHRVCPFFVFVAKVRCLYMLVHQDGHVKLSISEIKKRLQDHLQEGLLIVVGTGPSIAEGIPGMGLLGQHLKAAMPPRLATSPDDEWSRVVTQLDGGKHLEAAMTNVPLKASTVDLIVEETAKLIRNKEREVFDRVLSGKSILPFTVFARHLFKAARKFHLITPNYDRLIELATEAAGIGVDNRFCGQLFGTSNPKRSADLHRESVYAGRNAIFRDLPCLCVHKPHGSLDWFEVNGKVVRCPIECTQTPVIITPGTRKYRESFRWAFDDQRAAGNKAISAATRFMFIGYGFNDDHLEQYACPNLTISKPTVLLAKDLTDNARQLVINSKNADVIALSAVSQSDLRTRITTSNGGDLTVDEHLWNLKGFNEGVL